MSKHICKVVAILTVGLCMQPNIDVSAKAAARLVSWLQHDVAGHAALAFDAILKVDPPLVKSWQHLITALCKAQQASKALSALQHLSHMGSLPSQAVAEVCQAMVNLAGRFLTEDRNAFSCCCHPQACLD